MHIRINVNFKWYISTRLYGSIVQKTVFLVLTNWESYYIWICILNSTVLKHRQNITSPLLMIHFFFWTCAILAHCNSDVNENCKYFITWYLNFVRILMLWNKKIWYVWFVNVALHWHWWFLLCCKFADSLKK